MPFSNLCISTNFGIGKCEGMGRGGGDQCRLIRNMILLKEGTSSTDIRLRTLILCKSCIPFLWFHSFNTQSKPISHNILI